MPGIFILDILKFQAAGDKPGENVTKDTLKLQVAGDQPGEVIIENKSKCQLEQLDVMR